MAKKNYRSNIIGFVFLFIALTIFFVGPRLVETNDTRDIDSTIDYVQKSKCSKEFKRVVTEQLQSDKKFAQQNGNPVTIIGITLPAVYWLAVLVVVLGWGIPVIMKYLDNKKAKAEAG